MSNATYARAWAKVTIVIYGNTTNIHSDFALFNGLKNLFFISESVIKLKTHVYTRIAIL